MIRFCDSSDVEWTGNLDFFNITHVGRNGKVHKPCYDIKGWLGFKDGDNFIEICPWKKEDKNFDMNSDIKIA